MSELYETDAEREERDRLVLEVMALAFAVDRMTDYAVFIDYSGHVESLTVKIVESKARWQNEIASTEFYITARAHTEAPSLTYLTAKRDHLRSIADTGGIDTGAMEEVCTSTYSHHF